MHDSHQALGRHDLDDQRQVGQQFDIAGLLDTGPGVEPCAAVGQMHFRYAACWIKAVCLDCHLLVVAAHGMEPWLGQPGVHLVRLRPAVDQVTYGEQPISGRIKAVRVQGALQAGKVPVNVAHREVAAGVVDWESLQNHGRSPIACVISR